MQPYTTATGTKTTLDALAAAGWGMLVTPDAYTPGRVEFALAHAMPIAIDNGAWSAFNQGLDWDDTYRKAFERLVLQLGDVAEWVVAPDIVAGGEASLELSESWLPWLLDRTEIVLVPVQDGMEPSDLARVIDRGHGRVGIFLGGSTEWKWKTAPAWGDLAEKWGVPFHLARVNSKRAIRIAQTAGATSFDGTSPVQFPSSLERLERERAQGTMALHAQRPCCSTPDEWIDVRTGEAMCMNCLEPTRPGMYWTAGEPEHNPPVQPELFPDLPRSAPPERRPVQKRRLLWDHSWIRRRVRAATRHSKGDMRYDHPSGWSVQRVEHGWANYPYFATMPNGDMVVDHNGRGFGTLKRAKESVEFLLDGRAKLTRHGEYAPRISRRR